MSTLIPHLQEQVHSVVGRLKGVTRRKVLASDGWFVAGKLFTLVNRQARIVVKLSDAAAQDELLALDGTEMWKIGQKPPMRAWLLLPESMHDDEDELRAWLRRAWSLASSEPAKKKKR